MKLTLQAVGPGPAMREHLHQDSRYVAHATYGEAPVVGFVAARGAGEHDEVTACAVGDTVWRHVVLHGWDPQK